MKRLVGRAKRKRSIRKTVSGTSERPRLTIFRSLKHMYAQVIDDSQGRTLVSASTRQKGLTEASGKKADRAKAIGQAIAEKCKEHGIEQVVFDRNGYKYHGRVKAVADGAREGGLSL